MGEVWRDKPYVETVKEMSLEELTAEMNKKATELAGLGVTTPVKRLLEGVHDIGTYYDSVIDKKGRVSVTGASIIAAINDYQSELKLDDPVIRDQLVQTAANIAVAIEVFHEKAPGLHYPDSFIHPPTPSNTESGI